MPYEEVIHYGNYSTQRTRCGYGTDTFYNSPTNFSYKQLERQYNSVQSRVKPDPLTDTALAKQYVHRRKHGVVGYDGCRLQNNVKVTLPPCSLAPVHPNGYRDRMAKTADLVALPTFVFPSWSNAVLDVIMAKRVNLGSSLAEYRASANMFKQWVSAVHTGYQMVKGRAPRHIEITPCTIAAADVGYAFGVAPLTEDLFSTVEALRLKLENPLVFYHRKRTFNRASGTVPDLRSSGILIASDRNWKYTATCTANIRVTMKPDNRVFTFGNPSIYAWELLPFSWLLDWGVSVGTWLERLDALRYVDSVKGTVTERVHYSRKFRAGFTDVYGADIKGTWGHHLYKSHERKVVNSLVLPSLPRWSPSASWNKLRRALTVLVVISSGRINSEVRKDPSKYHPGNPCGKAIKKPKRVRPRDRHT